MENATCLWEEGGRPVLDEWVSIVFFHNFCTSVHLYSISTVKKLNLKDIITRKPFS